MSASTVSSAKQAGKKAMGEAKHAATNPWVERLERFGFLMRGLVYIVIGVLALQLAVGAGGGTESPTSAIALIGAGPLGQMLMVIVVVGLAGYGLWGFVRAIFDPLRRGTSQKGLMARAGFLASGLSYGLTIYPIVLTLLHKGSGGSGGSGLPAGLTDGPNGKWLVMAIGAIWLVAGGAQLLAAYRSRFTRDLKTSSMKADEIQAMTWLGRIGYAARGVVFVLVGVLTFQTVMPGGAQAAPSFDGALATLAHSASGEIVLGLVALGLIMFGAFSAACAKWNKISVGEPS